MKKNRWFTLAGLACWLAPCALPQSLPNLPLVRLAYTVKKRTVNPQGELKEKIDANDRALNAATRTGNQAEVRRLLAEGMTLLNGEAWTDQLDYANSLALRADHVFIDTSKPCALRLEQIYMPSISLENSLTTKVSLHKPGAGRGGAPGELVKELATFDEVSRDLRESPFLMELDLSSVADGAYQMQADVFDGSKLLGSAGLRVTVKKDLDAKLAQLEKDAGSLPEALRADALYPIDFVHNVNRARIDTGAFEIGQEIATANEIVAAAKAGKDPFAGRTGDFKRHYVLKSAAEIMPYRLYIPANYDGRRAFPLIVALHGLGGTEDSMFGKTYGMLPEAEKRGYILVAPLGYRVDGGYGRVTGGVRRAQLSEDDVLEVLARVRKAYRIDDDRIYLMGHSLGGIGTWTLGAKHPEIWAALGPIAGTASPKTVEAMRRIPEIVVHGDADTVVPVDGSRNMVAEMRKLDVDVKYIEVPGGSHTSIAGPNMPALFDFFDTHKKHRESPSAGNAAR